MISNTCPSGYEIVIKTIPSKEINMKDITLDEIEKCMKRKIFVADADTLSLKSFHLYEVVKKIKKVPTNNQTKTKYKYKNSYRERMREYEQEFKQKMYEE